MSHTSVQASHAIRSYQGESLREHFPRWTAFLRGRGEAALSRRPEWLNVLFESMGHVPHVLEAQTEERTCGLLFLADVKSWLFGNFLVSMPYLNSGGVVAEDATIAQSLIGQAAKLADQLEVKYLELRHEHHWEHAQLTDQVANKVHMRLALPSSAGQLWDKLKAKVRNQVRKAQENNLEVVWGQEDLLNEMYQVFSTNMRDLGTPVYPKKLFLEILRAFPGETEIGVVRHGKQPIAVGLLLHGEGVTEIPSASSLREHNSLNGNMLLYWHSLERAIERGQTTFDFGRSTPDSGTYRFKKQWGAEPEPAIWQYYRRHGDVQDARPDNPKYQRLIKIWQKLPVSVANLLGPFVVRGIP